MNNNNSSNSGPDEMHILQLLLLNTSMVIRVGRATSKPFSNDTGKSPGDGLSPVLFTCYLAAALKDTKHRLPTRPRADAYILHGTEYADGINNLDHARLVVLMAAEPGSSVSTERRQPACCSLCCHRGTCNDAKSTPSGVAHSSFYSSLPFLAAASWNLLSQTEQATACRLTPLCTH